MKLLNEDAGGMLPGHQLKACIPGGASAPILVPQELETLTLDYEAMAAVGTMLGSGAVMMIDHKTSMVDLLKIITDFFAHESCGQCTPCREGTGWLANIMAGVVERRADANDVDRMHTIAAMMGGRTICALSDAAAMPTMSIIKKFGNEIKDYLKQELRA
jgi:NADH-quinone oxidoreductase subunit F